MNHTTDKDIESILLEASSASNVALPNQVPTQFYAEADTHSTETAPQPRPRSQSNASRYTNTDAKSMYSARSDFGHIISRTNTAHSNPVARAITQLVEAVRDDNIITEKQHASEEMVIPDTGLNIIEKQVTRQITRHTDCDVATTGFSSGVDRRNSDPETRIEYHGTEEKDSLSDEAVFDPTNGAPDGGYSWVIAVCCCFLSSATWGANASYGVFLNYFISSNYFPGATDFDFAMIGGLVIGISTAFAPFVFILVSYIGLKPTMLLGVSIQTCGYILAGFVKTKAGLYCTQGMMIGLSFGMIFTSSIAILPNWFYYKRSIAAGMTVSGSGLGGVIFSLSANSLMQRTGSHRWPLIMVGLVTCAICVTCIVLIQEHPKTSPKYKSKAPRPGLWPTIQVVLNPRIVLNVEVTLVGLWFMCCNVGYITLLFSMSAYASSVGLTHQQGSNLTAIMNVGQFVGRPTMGHFSDRFGRINFSLMISFTVGVLIFAYWVNADTYGSLIGFALLTGFTVGIGAVNNQPLAVDASGLEMFPAAFSYLSWIISPLLAFSEVIALKLKKPQLSRPFLYCQIMTGCFIMLGCLLLMLMRELKITRVIVQRKGALEEHIRVHTFAEGSIQSGKELQELTPEEIETNERRLHKYEFLLRGGVKGYLTRMFYPIKV
ncbi:hypothetical protein BABINDRAFT_159685 [Babjeviella inositovora NRRL Y-12698]|uniref:Major facilitator superfamily (MFS) profile domain-containing protein n=1 Tax=Babjeviella inositovora NRRL Y-12698 TaxID=984486 RepID=A0A1E3QZY5_9ASCO|nr:uncharacterized protein BABINDRAFT_159685 [Babjeviella inositovora NRRL Y-12698]ODQ83250.1 hypothetical protein BABINDRAFT_159685 [Babjeviella inositovora NRRL Y-12698]